MQTADRRHRRRRTRRLASAAMLVVTLLGAAVAHGADHKNLDEGRPLRLEDALPIETGGWEVLAGAGVTLSRAGPTQGSFPLGLQYGLLPHLQIGLGVTPLAPEPTTEVPRSDDVQVSARYSFFRENAFVPALAFKLGVTLPTGAGSRGFPVEVKAMATKIVGQVGLHLNAATDVLTDPRRDERDARYRVAAGASHTLAQQATTTLVGDVFVRQPLTARTSSAVGLEAGVRHQLVPNLVIDVGVGTEVAGPRDRAPFFLNTGISFDF